jgi:hypothetical protein
VHGFRPIPRIVGVADVHAASTACLGKFEECRSDPIPPCPDVICFEPHGVVPEALGEAILKRRAARRRSSVAARGAGTAAGDAGDWVDQQQVANRLGRRCLRLPSRSQRNRFCRRQGLGDRISLGRWSIRPIAGNGVRSRAAPGQPDRCGRWRRFGPGRQSSNFGDSNCLRHGRRGPGQVWPRRQSQPAGRQHHGHDPVHLPCWGQSDWSCCARWCPKSP